MLSNVVIVTDLGRVVRILQRKVGLTLEIDFVELVMGTIISHNGRMLPFRRISSRLIHKIENSEHTATLSTKEEP